MHGEDAVNPRRLRYLNFWTLRALRLTDKNLRIFELDYGHMTIDRVRSSLMLGILGTPHPLGACDGRGLADAPLPPAGCWCYCLGCRAGDSARRIRRRARWPCGRAPWPPQWLHDLAVHQHDSAARDIPAGVERPLTQWATCIPLVLHEPFIILSVHDGVQAARRGDVADLVIRRLGRVHTQRGLALQAEVAARPAARDRA